MCIDSYVNYNFIFILVMFFYVICEIEEEIDMVFYKLV